MTGKSIKIAVEVTQQGNGRFRSYTAKAGCIEGTGATEGAALGWLGSLIAQATERGATAPSFAWDAANKILWVAIDDPFYGGCHEYPVQFGDSGIPFQLMGVTSSRDTADQTFRRSTGMKMLGRPGKFAKLPAADQEYLEAVLDANRAKVARWLTGICPQCDQAVPGAAGEVSVDDAGHVTVDGAVAIGCQGYWVISPAALGLGHRVGESWADWSRSV